MSEGSVTFKVKVGSLEVEYQGEPAFLESRFMQLAKEVLDLYEARRGSLPQVERSSVGSSGVGALLELSTDTIATLLGANSGPDLVIAAAAHLQFAKGKSKFSRQELIDEMRTAPNHFKETFVNNLSQYLARLGKADRLRSVATDTYALSSKEKTELEGKLANAQ